MILWLILACAEQAVTDTTCDTLCTQLVMECDYAAYPSYDSCVQGCGYQAEQGGDVDGEQACIAKAKCDTFAILECEHKFGAAQ